MTYKKQHQYKIPTHYADAMAAVRQEQSYKRTARAEEIDERKRARIWKKKGFTILASELAWDSENAAYWVKKRAKRVKKLKSIAKRYKK